MVVATQDQTVCTAGARNAGGAGGVCRSLFHQHGVEDMRGRLRVSDEWPGYRRRDQARPCAGIPRLQGAGPLGPRWHERDSAEICRETSTPKHQVSNNHWTNSETAELPRMQALSWQNFFRTKYLNPHFPSSSLAYTSTATMQTKVTFFILLLSLRTNQSPLFGRFCSPRRPRGVHAFSRSWQVRWLSSRGPLWRLIGRENA